MKKEIIEIICVLGVVQGAFIGAVLLTIRRNKTANIFLAAFLFVISFAMSGRYASVNGMEFWRYGIHYYLLVLPSLMGPLVFLYTDSLIHDIDRVHLRYLVHLILPGILLVTGIILHITQPFIPLREVVGLKYYALTVLIVSLAAGLFYIIFSLLRLRNYRKNAQQYFSNMEKVNLQWLRVLLTMLLFASLSWNMALWIRALLDFQKLVYFSIFSQGTIVFIVFLTSYYAIKQPEIFGLTVMMEEELIDDHAEAGRNVRDTARKYEKQTIAPEVLSSYMSRLTTYMDEKQPYLRESLTLKELADSLQMSTHHLSMIINGELNQNFYYFINSYRVKAAKNMISSEDFQQKSILEVAYDAGFSSKTTFNAMFKKITGMTPSEYRNSVKR